MHVVVLGGGSLGSLFAGKLATAGPVTLVDHDPAHVDAIRSVGLALTSPDGSVETIREIRATTNPAEVSDPDLLLLCVKAYDTEAAIEEASQTLLDDSVPVLTLQNGLGNAESIADHIPERRIYAGTTAHGARLEVAGRVRHAGTGPTLIGPYFDDTDEQAAAIVERFRTAGLDAEPAAHIRDAIWEKLLINCGINAATALARVPNGATVDVEAGRHVRIRAIEEGKRVADASGRDIDESVFESSARVARQTASNHSSMWVDLETGSRTEIDAINGAIVDRGDRHNIETPVNETLAHLIRLAESQLPE